MFKMLEKFAKQPESIKKSLSSSTLIISTTQTPAAQRRRKAKLGMLIAPLLFVTTAAEAVLINFNDGSNGSEIGSFYSSLGVTFLNAKWDNFVSSNEGNVGASGLKLVGAGAGGNNIYMPTQSSPIIATFDFGITGFSIYGLNVGENGARIDVYSAQSGGTLLGFAEAFGIDIGGTNHPLLVSSASPIYRVEFYQPRQNILEGMLWDNMGYERSQVSVPEPASLALLGLGLAGLGFMRRRRRV